ncbi:hypothetical protein PInf_018224 [Phytophthora infestans]|nr:hypothetical protein PInf_018224 [Phytophthora infestans]
MKSLTCVVVGDGKVFVVEIDERKKVGILKKMIKEKKTGDFLADQLTLYVAKKGIEDLMEKKEIRDEDDAGEDETHVLVKLPACVDQRVRKKARLLTPVEHTKLNTIATALQIEQWQVGGLALGIRDIEPDFPEYFYVWKETLDIIKIFRRQLEKDRSVVFVGTPGVGKSMLVVLFAFHMALCQQKRVVLLRKLKRKGFTLLYLDPECQRYWHKEEVIITDLDLLEHRDFELCLDGFLHHGIESNFGRLARFRLLATPAQYKMKDDDIEVLRQCIVPCWSKADLRIIGRYRQWTESDINDRFFASGGNLCIFLAGKNAAETSINLAIAGSAGYVAELVSTQYGRTSVPQMDCLRMTAIPAHTSTENQKDCLRKYVDCGEWVCGITSQYALRQLGKAVQPSYYEKLWSNARKIGDDALMEIAFENYVHSMARDGKKIELQVRSYDRRKQQQHTMLRWSLKPTRIATKEGVQWIVKQLCSNWRVSTIGIPSIVVW